MHVVHVIEGLGPGGAERSLVELLPLYAAAGVRSTVAHFKERPTGFADEARRIGCDMRRIRGESLTARTAELRRLLQETEPDLVHTSLFRADLVGRVGAFGTGIPVLSSLVNTTYDPVRGSDPHLNQLGFRMVRAVDRFTARHLTTHFHAITNAVKASYVRALGLPPERISVVERGRSLARIGERSPARRGRMRELLGIAQKRPVLVNVGRQEYQKGQRYLIEAMPLVLRRHPSALLLMVGHDGAESARIREAAARHQLHDAVRFLGYRTDVADVVAAADVFVFPSLFEGLGGAAIEAMALGVPIVASDIPVLREVVGDAGCYAAPGTPAALAQAASDLLSDREGAEARGREGLARFRSRFTIEGSAERMVSLYRSLATT